MHGQQNIKKNVEQLTDLNKLYYVAYCLIIIAILVGMLKYIVCSNGSRLK